MALKDCGVLLVDGGRYLLDLVDRFTESAMETGVVDLSSTSVSVCFSSTSESDVVDGGVVSSTSVSESRLGKA